MVNSSTFGTMSLIKDTLLMQDGEKFIKWDDDSGIGTPVTMRIDPAGFFLYWIDQNNEMDILDISSIRDVRTGKYAKRPKDTKLRQIVTLGSQDTLENKTVTICHGADFVNVTFLNFSCTKKEIAQLWSDKIMKLAYNLDLLNGSVNTYLKKAHTKLCLQTDKMGNVPVKNIIKLFTQNKDDKKRVEKAMENTGLPSRKVETISINKFSFEEFFNLYKNLVQRTEVEKIFDNLIGDSKRKYMSTVQLVEFLNKTQRDPRLNEILYPYANTQRAKEIIQQYEPNKFNIQKGLLSLDGFLRYLMSQDNPIISISKFELCDDMDQPLSHYFINSSHNTYLTGHQLTGKSSVEIYRQCLLAGCRCVELDFWNGRTEEPVIVHGYTFVPEIYAKDVLEAIAESAFKTSEFPVILSFENHCNSRQQAKIANYCREVFGDMLLDQPLDTHPLEPNVDLPPPSSLKRKIIIKNKKKHHHHHHKKSITVVDYKKQIVLANTLDVANKSSVLCTMAQNSMAHNADSATTTNNITSNYFGESQSDNYHSPSSIQMRQNSKDSSGSSDTDSSSEDDSQPVNLNLTIDNGPSSDKVQKETEAGAEISALVNYVQPIHFSSFENAEKKGRFYEMSSFDEKQATALLKERPIEFVNYNKHQLSRVYPTGTRFDSSNFMPQIFWNAGCQLVALNFQTLDLAMQLNLGIFEYNRRSGYLLKPEFMRRADRRLDPFAESTVDGIIAGTVSITVLSGQFLSDKRVGTYVEVDMFGLPADTMRKKFRTKTIRDNSINPVYDEDPFVFKKVVLPELASIRIAAYEDGGKFIGHRVLPVIGLCPGYRHLNLRNEVGQPLLLSTLFLYIVVKDYIPDDLSNFAEALANPIKYQNELEKRDKQLAVLTEDTEPAQQLPEHEIDCTGTVYPKKDKSAMLEPIISPKHGICLNARELDLKTNQDTIENACTVAQNVYQQHTLESSVLNVVKHNESSQFDIDCLICESLDVILGHKMVREKCLELEKKLEALRKKHDKDKLKVATTKLNTSDTYKRPKFAITNKLVKRLSTKNFDPNVEIPPCVNQQESTEASVSSLTTKSDNDRLMRICQDYSQQYREMQKKYYETIYNTAEKVLIQSQAHQMKLLKSCLEKTTTEVMHQLQETRKTEIKHLASIHRDRDEFVRMKREVASSIVERGVAERLRLKQAYDSRTDELHKQHEFVRNNLTEHKSKAKDILKKESESHICIMTNGFLELFSNSNPNTDIPDDIQPGNAVTKSVDNSENLKRVASYKSDFEIET